MWDIAFKPDHAHVFPPMWNNPSHDAIHTSFKLPCIYMPGLCALTFAFW